MIAKDLVYTVNHHSNLNKRVVEQFAIYARYLGSFCKHLKINSFVCAQGRLFWKVYQIVHYFYQIFYLADLEWHSSKQQLEGQNSFIIACVLTFQISSLSSYCCFLMISGEEQSEVPQRVSRKSGEQIDQQNRRPNPLNIIKSTS